MEYVEVEAVIRHPAFRDVDIELVSPSGAVSRLAEYGASAPALALRGGVRLGTARHLGEDPTGMWTLRVRDGAASNDGVLLSWSLTIHGHGRATNIPVVTGVDGVSTSLRVTWTIDDAAGVTAYDVRHIGTTATDKGDSNWTVTDNAWTSTAGGALSYAITGLTNGTSYDVQVRAVRDTTDGSWSETAVGTPGRGGWGRRRPSRRCGRRSRCSRWRGAHLHRRPPRSPDTACATSAAPPPTRPPTPTGRW